MADASSSPSNSGITRLILIPALITLLVTCLRLTGELMHWSNILFSRAEGGGGAIIGITWLPFIFGPYFAVTLWDQGLRPTSRSKTIIFAIAGILVLGCGGLVAFAPVVHFSGRVVLGLLLIVGAAALQFFPWKALAKTLIAYAYAARIPVAIVMFFAMSGSWGTHYDAVPPENAHLAFWPKYLYLGIAPQLVMWIAYTMTVGALLGGIYVAIVRRGKSAAASASEQASSA
jgi:hypothetical protein